MNAPLKKIAEYADFSEIATEFGLKPIMHMRGAYKTVKGQDVVDHCPIDDDGVEHGPFRHLNGANAPFFVTKTADSVMSIFIVDREHAMWLSHPGSEQLLAILKADKSFRHFIHYEGD